MFLIEVTSKANTVRLPIVVGVLPITTRREVRVFGDVLSHVGNAVEDDGLNCDKSKRPTFFNVLLDKLRRLVVVKEKHMIVRMSVV